MAALDASAPAGRAYSGALLELGAFAMKGGSWAAVGSICAHGLVLAVGLHFAHASGGAQPPRTEAPADVEVDVSLVEEPLPLVVPASEPADLRKHGAPQPTAPPKASPPHAQPSPSPPSNSSPAPSGNAGGSPSEPASTEAPRAAETVIAADQGEPSFVLPSVRVGGVGGVGPSGTASPPSAGAGVPTGVEGPLSESAVSARAHLTRGGTPAYPPRARGDGIEGDVVLELVLSASGSVEAARVAHGVGHGLDEAALDAVKSYRFSPAQKDGRAVRVRMLWTVQFRLQ